MSLPAGKFVVNVTAVVQDDVGGNNEVEVSCSLLQDGSSIGDSLVDVEGADLPSGSMAITAAPTFGAAGTLSLACGSFDGSDNFNNLLMTAVKVDDITIE
jgi:hypothetical protein